MPGRGKGGKGLGKGIVFCCIDNGKNADHCKDKFVPHTN